VAGEHIWRAAARVRLGRGARGWHGRRAYLARDSARAPGARGPGL